MSNKGSNSFFNPAVIQFFSLPLSFSNSSQYVWMFIQYERLNLWWWIERNMKWDKKIVVKNHGREFMLWLLSISMNQVLPFLHFFFASGMATVSCVHTIWVYVHKLMLVIDISKWFLSCHISMCAQKQKNFVMQWLSLHDESLNKKK